MSTEAPDRVIIAGDWHSNTPWAVHVVEEASYRLPADKPKIILQLGDFGVWYGSWGDMYLNELTKACRDLGVEIWFIDGNHEAFPRLRKEFRGERGTEIVWLERGSRWVWHGRTWMALGGATSLDKDVRTENADWFPDEELTLEDCLKACEGGKAEVMITHDCPSAVVHTFPEFGFPAHEKNRAEQHSRKLQSVVNNVQPEYLMHGHLHILYQRTQFMPYGECTVTGLGMDGGEDNWFILDTHSMEFLEH